MYMGSAIGYKERQQGLVGPFWGLSYPTAQDAVPRLRSSPGDADIPCSCNDITCYTLHKLCSCRSKSSVNVNRAMAQISVLAISDYVPSRID